MTRRIALLAFAVAAIAALGLGLGARGAEAAPGLQAYAGGPYSNIAGAAIQFDGTASSGIGLSYFWTFGDGTTAAGARPVKAYAAAGVYRVTLTVQDYTGAQSVAATSASVGGSRLFVPGGCYTTFNGIVCGSTLGSVFAGCYLTVAGWVCPGATFPVVSPGGVIVSGSVFAASALSHCANPNYALTPFCRDLR